MDLSGATVQLTVVNKGKPIDPSDVSATVKIFDKLV